ncbi:hypothetical protein GCM10009838_43930 [Catenulispora subtropica]|uniref:Uncharacterized protein n=1 Tax=Catenulispora subtropica TaxID=450798 RepID=A0ABP5DDG9_9ACTN
MDDDWDEHAPDILRALVDEAAEQSRTLGRGPDVEAATEFVRGRRRRRAALQVGGTTTAVAMVAAVAAAVAVPAGHSKAAVTTPSPGIPTSPRTVPSGRTASGSAPASQSPSTQLQPDRPGVVCGQRLTAQYAAQAPGGVHVVVTAEHPQAPATAPTVDVAVTADRALTVSGSPRHLDIQVVVLHEGTVVDRIGGAAWPDDFTPQPGRHYGDSAEARSWPVDAGRPHTEQIAPSRWTACSGVDWAAIYSHPAEYQLIALMPIPMVFDADGPVADHTEGLLGSPPLTLTR